MFLSKLKIQVFIASASLLITWMLYAKNAVSPFFIFYNLVILFSLYGGLRITLGTMLNALDVRCFRRRLFFIAFFTRLSYMLILLFLWYFFTDTPFSVEAIDALSFHREGLRIASDFSTSELFYSKHFAMDDRFYPFLLGTIYYWFGESVLFVRIIQVFVSSLTVVCLYDAIKIMDDEIRARIASLVLCFTGVVVFYTGVHMKETWMMFFLMILVRSVIFLVHRKHVAINSILIAVSLFALLGMRFALFFIALFSIVFYLVFVNKIGKNRVNFVWKAVVVCLIATASYLIFNNTTYWDFGVQETENTVSRSEDNQSSGGRAGKFTSQSLTKTFSAGIIALPISFVTPFPSLTKTNINPRTQVKQTEQWYHIGNLFFWGILSYFFFIGFYMLYKRKLFKKYMIFLFLAITYTLALLVSMYLTSIRFNVIKIFLMVPIVAFGISTANSKSFKYWTPYTLVYCILVLIWNYLKLARVGMI